MLKKLRLRLTILATFLTGAVLVVMTVAALTISENMLETSATNAFKSNLNAIIAKLQNDQVLSNTWLAQTESDDSLIISITDAGQPFHFSGSWTPQTDRGILIARAQEKGRAEGMDVSIPPFSVLEAQSLIIRISGDNGDHYLAAVSVVPSHGGWQGLTILKDMSSIGKQILGQRVAFAMLVVAGIILLWFLCWYFAGKSIRPIEESRKRQTEFIAAASHELRSPLTVIRTSASALNPGEAEFPQLCDNIDRECIRMTRLIDDLLILAGSDAKTWSIHNAQVDLDTLLLETAELFYPIAAKKGQLLLLEVPEDTLPPISGDEQRLKQVLTILLDNAFSYTPEGGRVTLQAVSSPHHIRLRVCDTGPGIPEEHIDHIFDRFYRADSSRNDKNHFGLGLSIAEELTALHHGKLRVKSTGSDGTVFEIELPKGK